MTLANMGLTLGLIPFAAHLADKGLPKLAATMGVLVVAAVCSIPMLLAVSSQSMVAAWLMQVRVRPAGRHSAQNHALFTFTTWERDMGWQYAASSRLCAVIPSLLGPLYLGISWVLSAFGLVNRW